MKKPVLLTALLAAAVLSGCSWLRLGDASDAAIGQDPSSPRLSVSGGKLKVSLDPLRFTRKDGAVTITFRLPSGGRYRFDESAVVFEEVSARTELRGKPTDEFKCQPGLLPNEHVCLNYNRREGLYKYTVRALEDGKPLAPYDPFVHNGP